VIIRSTNTLTISCQKNVRLSDIIKQFSETKSDLINRILQIEKFYDEQMWSINIFADQKELNISIDKSVRT
jgi:hypothetical protein